MATGFSLGTPNAELGRTTDLPGTTNLSFGTWIQPKSIGATGNWRAIWAARGSGGDYVLQLNGSQLNFYANGSEVAAISSVITVNNWFWVGFTLNGTGAGSIQTYIRTLTGNTLSNANATRGSTLTVNTKLYLGQNAFDEPSQMWFVGARQWNETLSAQEMLAESYSMFHPVRRLNLYGAWPLRIHTDIADYSGNGRNWTSAGTLTTQSDPGVRAWAPRRRKAYIPAGGAVTNSVTASTNAVIQATQTKTASTNAVIQATQTKTASTNAVIQGLLSRTASANALIAARLDETADANAVIQAVLTQTASANAVIQGLLTKTATANAVIQATQTKTVSANAVINASTGVTATANAVIQATQAKTASADAIIQVLQAKTASANANILLLATKTASANALVQAIQTQTASSDAVVQGLLTATASANAVISTTASISLTADANAYVILPEGEDVATTNAILFDNEVSYVLGRQRTNDSAILSSTSTIDPPLSNVAASGIALSPTDEAKAGVKAYIQWYVSKLNLPDSDGIFGTVDKYASGSPELSGTASVSSTTVEDSLACAAFMVAVKRFFEGANETDQEYIRDTWTEIELVASVPLRLMQSDNLLWSRVSNPTKKLVDNCAVYEGLSAAAWLGLNAIGSPSVYDYYTEKANLVKDAIETEFWDGTSAYKISKSSGGSFTSQRITSVNITTFTSTTVTVTSATGVQVGDVLTKSGLYSAKVTAINTNVLTVDQDLSWGTGAATCSPLDPDWTSQLAPIYHGVIAPTSSRAQAIWARFNLYNPRWYNLIGSSAPNAFMGLACAIMGDRYRANTFIAQIKDSYVDTGHISPYNAYEAGWLLRTLGYYRGTGAM